MLRDHPYFEVTALAASDRSEGKRFADVCNWKLPFETPEAAKDIKVFGCKPPLDCDLVISSLPSDIAVEAEVAFAAAGFPVISNSSSYRMPEDVPLVVPEINPDHLEVIPTQKKNRGYNRGYIVTNPNCTTIGLVMALEPLRRAAGLAHVAVTTLQAASGAGREGLAELANSARALTVFPRELAGNVIPQCEKLLENDYTTEEEKLRDETRKILALPALPVTMTCVRVPVAVGHSAAVLVETERALAPREALAALRAFPGVSASEHSEYPTPLEVAGRDEVFVGRVRSDPTHPRRLWLWCVIDNLRKGAATNAVQIAEELLARR
jgi:aspartate-semialdehyde dehydrogenase